MNREIKFRGKRKDNNEWAYGSLICYPDRTGIVVFTTDTTLTITGTEYEVHPDSVGEYTGLKDRKGVEIYEGNVVDFGYNKNWEIWFERGFFQTRDKDGFAGHHGIWNYKSIENIGNVHDNPALLGEKK